MKKDPLVWIALLSLFVFHVVSNMAILFRDATPFIDDASSYYRLSFYYWKTWMEFIKSGDLSLFHRILGMGLGGELPALVAIPFFSVFGVSHDAALLADQSFFLILILSLYGLGKILFDRKAGLLAAFLITFYPGVIGFSRVYMLEVPILAITAACVYLLIKSEGFKNFKYSLCFGFAFALGELLRPRFVIYITIPVLFYAIRNIIILFKRAEIPAQISVKKVALNIFSSAAISYLLLLPWYSADKISAYLEDQKLWSSWPALSNIVSNLPFYLQMLLGEYLGWFFVGLFFLGLLLSLFEKDKRPRIYFLLMWFALTPVLISMLALKELPRLVVPLLAPAALISAAGIGGLSKRKIGKYLLIVFLFFAVFQYFFISYGHKSTDKEDAAQHLKDVFFKGLLQARNYDWNLDELMRTFEARSNSDEAWDWRSANETIRCLNGSYFQVVTNDSVRVLHVDFLGTVLHNMMEERILIEDLPVVVIGLYPDYFDYKASFSEKDLQRVVLGADYVITHKVSPKSGFVDKILAIFDANISRFEKLKTLGTPWGEISVYGRKKVEKNV